MSRRRVGITGSLASGKSSVLHEFKGAGWKTVSADQLVHAIYEKNKLSRDEIAKSLRSERAIRKLEKWIHPLVAKELKKWIKKHSKKHLAFEIPLLFEAGFEKYCDYTVFVYSPIKHRRERVSKRGMKSSLFKLLDARQLPAEKKAELSDFVIQNMGDKKLLRAQARFWARFLKDL